MKEIGQPIGILLWDRMLTLLFLQLDAESLILVADGGFHGRISLQSFHFVQFVSEVFDAFLFPLDVVFQQVFLLLFLGTVRREALQRPTHLSLIKPQK